MNLEVVNALRVAEEARVISLVIRSGAGDLVSVSDEVHLVPALSTAEVAVERVLSI